MLVITEACANGQFAEIVNCEPMTGQPVLMALLGPPYSFEAEGLSDEEIVGAFLKVARLLADHCEYKSAC